MEGAGRVPLALMLPLGGACASIAGLDETLAGYLDTDGDLRYSFALQVGTLLPYGEETLTMMNGRAGAYPRGRRPRRTQGPKARLLFAWTARA